ncbi:MAG: hypothetical protein JSS66_15450 [Armatimonadetes bacterium]|nr:hypothetical protein [Armatimonadota bacterium]
MRSKTILSLAAVACAAASQALSLTGITAYGVHGDNTSNGVEEWVTSDSSGEWNLYVQVNGQFVNWGNGANAYINVPLSMGKNTISVFADGAAGARYGMAFMFDGMNTAPRIAAANDQGASEALFQKVGAGISTLDIFGAPRPSPDSLVYSDGSVMATLTGMSFTNGVFGGTDLVSPHDLGANGRPDNFGTVTLDVQAVPEPCSMVAVGLGAIALLRKRAKN